MTHETEGKKDDAEKPRWELLPLEAVARVVDVLTYGAKKYGARSWRQLPEGRDRYFAATMRHLAAWRRGETTDPESRLPHLAHAACCLVFLLEIEAPVVLGRWGPPAWQIRDWLRESPAPTSYREELAGRIAGIGDSKCSATEYVSPFTFNTVHPTAEGIAKAARAVFGEKKTKRAKKGRKA